MSLRLICSRQRLNYRWMYSPNISEYFKQNLKSLSYLSLILHVVRSSQFVSCAVFDMSEINEQQRVCIKFCFKLGGKNATETYEMIKTALGDNSLSRSVIFEWCKSFKDGRQSTENDPRSGRPSTSRNNVGSCCNNFRKSAK